MIAVRYCSVFSLLSLLTPRPGKTPDTHYFSLLTQTYSLVRVRGRFALLRLFKGVRYTVYTKRPMSYNSHTSNKESLKNVPFFSLSVLTIFLATFGMSKTLLWFLSRKKAHKQPDQQQLLYRLDASCFFIVGVYDTEITTPIDCLKCLRSERSP